MPFRIVICLYLFNSNPAIIPLLGKFTESTLLLDYFKDIKYKWRIIEVYILKVYFLYSYFCKGMFKLMKIPVFPSYSSSSAYSNQCQFSMLAWDGKFLMKDFQASMSLAMFFLTFLSFRSLYIASFRVFLGHLLGN